MSHVFEQLSSDSCDCNPCATATLVQLVAMGADFLAPCGQSGRRLAIATVTSLVEIMQHNRNSYSSLDEIVAPMHVRLCAVEVWSTPRKHMVAGSDFPVLTACDCMSFVAIFFYFCLRLSTLWTICTHIHIYTLDIHQPCTTRPNTAYGEVKHTYNKKRECNKGPRQLEALAR